MNGKQGSQVGPQEETYERKEEKQTLGQKRVRLDFNPNGNQTVNDIKAGTASMIDGLEQLKKDGKDPRLIALAQTAYEEAAMWAVKAATS